MPAVRKWVNKRRPLGQRRNDSRIVDEKFLDAVRGMRCCATGSPGPSDPHHLVARGWAEAKRNDYTCIPLRRDKHSELEQIGQKKFESRYSISLWEINRRIVEKYQRDTGMQVPDRAKIYNLKLEET